MKHLNSIQRKRSQPGMWCYRLSSLRADRVAPQELPRFHRRLPKPLQEECWRIAARLCGRGLPNFMFCRPDGAKDLVVQLDDGDALVIPARSPVFDPVHILNYCAYLGDVALATLQDEFEELPPVCPVLLERVDRWLLRSSQNRRLGLHGTLPTGFEGLRSMVAAYYQQRMCGRSFFSDDIRLFRLLSRLRSVFVEPALFLAVANTDRIQIIRCFDLRPEESFPLRPPIYCLDGRSAFVKRTFSEYARVASQFSATAPTLLPDFTASLGLRLGISEAETAKECATLNLTGTPAVKRAGLGQVFLELRDGEFWRQNASFAAAATRAALDPTDDTALSELLERAALDTTQKAIQFKQLLHLFSKHLEAPGQNGKPGAGDKLTPWTECLVSLYEAVLPLRVGSLTARQERTLKETLRWLKHKSRTEVEASEVRKKLGELAKAGFCVSETVTMR